MKLTQPTKCSENNPLHMELRNIKTHPWHMHSENILEIIYVLKGTMQCDISIYPSCMKQGDIAVINTETLHSYESDEDNIILICHIDLSHFSSVIPEIDDTLIICNSAAAVKYDKHYELLKKALSDIFVSFFDIITPTQNELMDSCANFLSALYNHFNFLHHKGVAIQTENIMKQRPMQAERVKHIIKYIYNNLGNKIRLEDIAAQEYVSKYYLSHLTSEFLHMSFRDFLNMIRVIYAQEYLYGTNLSLTEIADKCGFSNTEYFRKAYLKHIGITPAGDRKRVAGHTINDMPFLDEDALLSNSIQDITALMHIKASSHAPAVNPLKNTSYSVTNIVINFADLAYKNPVNTWDTVSLDEPRHLLSHDTLDALAMLRKHGCFSKLCIKSELLTSLYTALGNWSFTGTFLKTLAYHGFTLLISGEICDDFINFSNAVNGPKLQFLSENQAFPAVSTQNQPADIIAEHLKGKQLLPSLYENKSGRPYLFDKNNLKTKAFYPYYFLNRLRANHLYPDNGCCVTHSDHKTAILLYNTDRTTKNNDAKVRKYMLNLKHISRNLIYQNLTIHDGYESESEIYEALQGSWRAEIQAAASLTPDRTVNEEILHRIRMKAYPDTKLATIDALPEYNLLLSVPPKAITLIELM